MARRNNLYRVKSADTWDHHFYEINKRNTDEHGWLWLRVEDLIYHSVATGELRVWMRSEMEKVNGDRKGLPRN